MTYENVKCELCQVTFLPGDDVVVCPDCGSPMHRDCWKELGHCANAEKHAAGFVWNAPIRPVSAGQAQFQTQEEAKAEEDTGSTGPFASVFGGYTEYQTGENSQFGPNTRIIGAKEQLGEFTVEDYGRVIQKNIHRFIPKFFAMEKSGKKFSLNIAAFLFPAYWAFYRKMYNVGCVLLVLSLLVPMIFIKDVAVYYNDYYEVLMTQMEYQSDGELTDAETEELNGMMPEAPLALEINSYVQMIIRVVFAVFANYIYKRHIENILKKEQTMEGTPEEKALRLKRAGGVSIVAALAAVAMEYALTAGGIALGLRLSGKALAATMLGRLF